MTDAAPSSTVSNSPAGQTADKAAIRKATIQAYYDAKTREEKAAVVKANPFLAEIFSAANHS